MNRQTSSARVLAEDPAPEATSPRPDAVLRVMVVEDDALTAMDLAAAIEAARDVPSIVVCTATDAPEALVGAREHQPHVAFVDANLRDGRTGPEIAELLSKHFGLAVVLASGDPGAFSDLRSGALCILAKPFTPQAVGESLKVVRGRVAL